MKHAVLIFACLVLLLSGITACRKKNNAALAPAKYTGCRISQITETSPGTNNNLTYVFTYNNDGTVATISTLPIPKSDVFIKSFTYNSNYVIMTTTDNGLAYEIDSLVLDGQNRITYIGHYGNNGSQPSNGVWDSYQYDSLGDMVLRTNKNYNTLSTETFSWKNGDLVWSTAGTDYYNYIYGADLYNTGNITVRPIDFETYGRAIYTSKHLRTQLVDDYDDTIYYTYILDTGGKLTYVKATEPGNYIYTTQISYTCE